MAAPENASAPGILENSVVNLGGLVAVSALGAVSGLITANALGPTAVGVLAVISGLTEFGRGLTSFTHTPSILEAHRGKDIGAVWGTSLALKLGGSLLFLIIALAAAGVVAGIFHVPAWALVLASLGLVLGTPAEVGAARYEAANQFRARNVLLAVGPIAGLASVLVFIALRQYSVGTAIVTSLIGTSVMGLAFWLHWKRPKMRYDRPIARTYVDQGSKLVLATFLTQLLLWTDTLLISALRGNAEAGVYNVVFQITFLLVTASTGIAVAALPAMSELAARGEDTRVAYQRSTLLALGLSLVIGLGYVLFGRLVLGLYGEEFVNGYLPLLVLTVFGTAGALIVPAQSVLVVHGGAKTVMLTSLGMAIANVPLNYVLIAEYGILGAAIATTIVFLAGLAASWWLAWRATRALPLSREVVREAWEKARSKLP